jgi:hypothetical protein
VTEDAKWGGKVEIKIRCGKKDFERAKGSKRKREKVIASVPQKH